MFRTPSRRRTTGILVAAATGATALALVAGVSTAEAATPARPATASSTTTAPSPTPTPKKAALPLPSREFPVIGFGKLVKEAPAQLKTDLTALKGKTPAERRAGLLSIETKASTGSYGAEVETVVTKAEALWKAAPAELKVDLKSLKGDTKAQKKAELKVIRHKADTGVYGTTVEADYKAVRAALKAAPKTSASAAGSSVGAIA